MPYIFGIPRGERQTRYGSPMSGEPSRGSYSRSYFSDSIFGELLYSVFSKAPCSSLSLRFVLPGKELFQWGAACSHSLEAYFSARVQIRSRVNGEFTNRYR